MIKKFFGLGDVFIYAISDTTLQGHLYKKGDIISYFSEVKVALGYDITHKEGSSTTRQLSYIEQEPYSLTISQVPNTEEVDKLFFAESVPTTIEYTTVTKYRNVKSIIFLTGNRSPFKVKMFSNGKEIEQNEEIYYDEEGKIINLDKSYDLVEVISYFRSEGRERTFDKPQLGYLGIKAVIEGKIGDKEGTFVLEIPKVDMVSEPMMDLTDESNYKVNLSFALINEKRSEPRVVFIDG